MTRSGRVVAVLAPPGPAFRRAAAEVNARPVLGDDLVLAMFEDVVDLVSDLYLVAPAVVLSPHAHDPPWRESLVALTWPGTPVLDAPTGEQGQLSGVLDALAGLDAEMAVVVAPDAPDLPGMLIGKLYRGLGRAEVAVCPAASGGLVALGCRLPAPDWLRRAAVAFDAVGSETGDGGSGNLGTGDVDTDAVTRLRSAAPGRGAVHVGPGWHRIRRPADLAALDPGLEGWAATRAALAAASPGVAPPG